MKSMDAYQNYTWLSRRISYFHEKRHYTFKTNRASEHSTEKKGQHFFKILRD